jgi:hypothetical protein
LALGASVRQTLSGTTRGGAEQGQREPKQRRELLDASPQLQHLLSEFRLREVRDIQTDHDRRRRTQPATRRGARDAEVRGDGHVPGAVDEMPKAVVVALLRAGRGRHGPVSSAVSSRRSNSSGTTESVRAGVTATRAAKSAECPWRQLGGRSGSRRNRASAARSRRRNVTCRPPEPRRVRRHRRAS